jgi:hypothetical protein
MNTHTQKGNTFAEGYVDVATRITEFRAKHPEGCLRPVDPAEPIRIVNLGDRVYLQYTAAAYRTPDDPAPGIGVAWEPYPGRTPFTRDSEAMVAETSAWGRAIVAVLAADTKRGVASAEEVTTAKQRRTTEPAPEAPITDTQLKRIGILRREADLDEDTYRKGLDTMFGVSSTKDLTKAQAETLIKKLSARGAAA